MTLLSLQVLLLRQKEEKEKEHVSAHLAYLEPPPLLFTQQTLERKKVELRTQDATDSSGDVTALVMTSRDVSRDW